MNNIIKILDPHEAIKIAAGEVVERPANIIKELLENSIDAQATNISLYLKSAGKELIKIVDDGSGMSPDDAILCFAHHATSKITKVDDLTTIETYGFRGEALSSIAAVSIIQLITKTKDQKIGTSIVFQNSKCIKNEQAAHQTGTTFIITNLFDNIPARKKFLKSDDTEWNQALAIFQAFCLRYLHINFKLYHNDSLIFNCQATETIAIRCGQLWSNNLHEQLIEIPQETTKNITLHGAISTPHYYRFNRGQIFIFVNNRWVKNHELMKAIVQGYEGVLPHQKYPAVFLFIQIEPHLIDVNIHPKKEEIKFLNPGIAQSIITSKIKEALNNFISKKLSPQKNLTEQVIQRNIPLNTTLFKEDPFLQKSSPVESETISQPIVKAPNFYSPSLGTPSISKIELPLTSSTTKTAQIIFEKKEINRSVFQEENIYSIVGQYHRTYIIIEQSNELILVDQHAAHERIIYEKLKIQGPVPSIQLMFPHIVTLTASNVTKINAHMHLLSEHGILIDQLTDTEIIITATPVGMQAGAVEEIIKIISDTTEQESLKLQLNEKILCEKACKTACKAGDLLDINQMQNLIKELMITPNRFCCPHGRPTMYNMALKDIEKHFKRDYVGKKEINTDLLEF